MLIVGLGGEASKDGRGVVQLLPTTSPLHCKKRIVGGHERHSRVRLAVMSSPPDEHRCCCHVAVRDVDAVKAVFMTWGQVHVTSSAAS